MLDIKLDINLEPNSPIFGLDYLDNYLERQVIEKFDDYVYDKHVGIKSTNNSRKYFVETTSQVEPKLQFAYPIQLEELYKIM